MYLINYNIKLDVSLHCDFSPQRIPQQNVARAFMNYSESLFARYQNFCQEKSIRIVVNSLLNDEIYSQFSEEIAKFRQGSIKLHVLM